MRLLFAVVFLFAASAHAGDVPGKQYSKPKQDHSCQGGHNCNTYGGVPSSNHSSSEASSVATGIGTGEAYSLSAGTGVASVGDTSSVSHGGAGGNGSAYVEGLSTVYSSEFDSWALALPGQTAAPRVEIECIVHLRGFSIASAGSSGRTKYDTDCVDFRECVAIADRLFAWGQIPMAVEQILSCDNAAMITAETEELTTVEIPEHTHHEYATREGVHRMFEEVSSK